MNSGMPNSAVKLSQALTLASGASGIFAWFINIILKQVMKGAIKKGLVIADAVHVGIIVPLEYKDFEKASDAAYEIVDQGKILTQEEKDAIDKPFMDALIKLGTFKLRK